MSARQSSATAPAARTEAWAPGSCAGEARALGGFLRTLELPAADAGAHADAFGRLRAGDLQAIVLHGVYPQAALSRAVDRLERNEPGFLQTWFPERFRAWFYGRNLNLADPALPGYFDEAARFQAQLETLFAPLPGIESHVGRLLACLDRSRPFVAAPGPEAGARYMFTTLRAHTEGGFIPAHFDNEQRLRESFGHLRGLVELHTTSFVLALSMAEAGGALEVFDLSVAPEEARLISDDRARDKPDITQLASVSFRLPPGTLIVLDSGRLLHRLTPVAGAGKRWTACSFMALARGGAATYCWG
ncbi:MAG: hypothetical protein ACREVQ_14575 [Burkholderiales bacterium]